MFASRVNVTQPRRIHLLSGCGSDNETRKNPSYFSQISSSSFKVIDGVKFRKKIDVVLCIGFPGTRFNTSLFGGTCAVSSTPFSSTLFSSLPSLLVLFGS